jgi:hypothetical protein
VKCNLCRNQNDGRAGGAVGFPLFHGTEPKAPKSRSSVFLTHSKHEHDFGIKAHNDWIARVRNSDAGLLFLGPGFEQIDVVAENAG